MTLPLPLKGKLFEIGDTVIAESSKHKSSYSQQEAKVVTLLSQTVRVEMWTGDKKIKKMDFACNKLKLKAATSHAKRDVETVAWPPAKAPKVSRTEELFGNTDML